jgi:sortase A
MTSQASLRRILWWTQRLLFAAGLVAIAYCCIVLVETWTFQEIANRELEKQFRVVDDSTAVPPLPSPTRHPTVIGAGGMVGRIQIPRLHLSAIVMEGTDRRTLSRAVGHIRGTALPGGPGNVGLAGHRDSFFRSLKDVRQHDVITFRTPGEDLQYLVESMRIVDPTDVSVLGQSSDEVLTLVTCYPFYFSGPAPNRFIVRALRIRPTPSVLRTQGSDSSLRLN